MKTTEESNNDQISMDDDTMLSPVFGRGDIISFADEQYKVIENNGSSGVVCPVGETYYISMFYWEFEGEECKLVKKNPNPYGKGEYV